jgi:hypothetical protein
MPVVRSWRARATADGARAYAKYFERSLAPELAAIPGHRGALVTSRAIDGEVELCVWTMWDSLDAIRKFSPDLDRAVVELEARALLRTFDERAVHAELVLDTTPGAPS